MISVLMPAYNTARFIRSAIQSVLDQAVPIPLELIVVDDGSTDETSAIVTEMAAQDGRIRLVSTENSGVSAARNRAFEEVHQDTKYIAYLDADDAYPMGRLSRDIALLEDDPTLEMVYGRQCLVTSESPDMALDIAPSFPSVRGPNMNVALFRHHIIAENGSFDTSFTHGEDLDFLLRIFERGPNYKILDEVSLFYRQRQDSACSNRSKLQRGVMRAKLLHAKRRRADPTLLGAHGVFAHDDFAEKLAVSVMAYYKRVGLPKYSLVIPAFNAGKFIAETIQSARDQTHPPDQIIVVNDGSTDNTEQVLMTLGNDIEVINQPNLGPAMATNAGIQAAHNDFIAFLDADDLWEPEKIAKQLMVFIHDNSVGIVFCRMASFNHEDADIIVDDSVSGWSRSTMFIRRKVIEEVGLIKDFQKRAGEMVDWIGRAKEANIGLKLIDLPMAKRRLHTESMTARMTSTDQDYLEVAKEAIKRRRALRQKQNDV